MVPETRERSLDTVAADYHEPMEETVPIIEPVEDKDGIMVQYMKP